MDSGNGTFITAKTKEMLYEAFRKEPSLYPLISKPVEKNEIFNIGEIIEIKGSNFRLEHIWANGKIQLQLLPRIKE